MKSANYETKWVTDLEIAALLSLNPGTIRGWRVFDAREGRGGPDNPGRGGLIWRRFGRAVRYLLTPELLGQEGGDAGEAR